MKFLVVDSTPVACSTLARGLTQTLHMEALCASSTADALGRIEKEKDAIGIVIFFLEAGPDAGLNFIRQVKELSEGMEIRCPKFVVLTPGCLTRSCVRKFRAYGAEPLLYGFEQQIYATVEQLLDLSPEDGRPMFVVDRSGGRTKVFLLGVGPRELFPCGPKLLPMMNYYAVNFGTELSTVALAEVADITIPWVRTYNKRLRNKYDLIRRKVGVDIPGKDVFCTVRKDGGYVHILKARVIFV